jgi:hypothetical protein
VFLTDARLVVDAAAPDLWWLDAPLVWQDAGCRITIPAGFVSDDASIPKALDWLPCFDRQGLSRRPGLLHDGLYALGRSRGKAFADNILRAACLAEGLSVSCAWAIYQGVNLFGQSSWDSDAREGIVGVESGDFISPEYHAAFVAAGGQIFSAPILADCKTEGSP